MKTRKYGLFLGALAISTILGASAFAQAPAGNDGGANSGRAGRRAGRNQNANRLNAANAGTLLAIPVATLDKLVTLTPDQKTKIADIQTKYKADAKTLRPARGAAPDPAARQKLRELTMTSAKSIVDLLTPEQKTKLMKISQEVAVLRALGIPVAAAAEIKLTPEQKTQIQSIVKDARDQVKGLTPEERRTRGRDILMAAREKVMAVLTPDQKAVIDKYTARQQRGNRANRPGRRSNGGAAAPEAAPQK